MIHPAIWEDPGFNILSIKARLLFIGMFSNADDEGRMRADAGSLKRLVFGFDDEITRADVQEMIQEIEKLDSIHFYNADGESYAHFTKWEVYQKLQKDRIQDSLLPMCSR